LAKRISKHSGQLKSGTEAALKLPFFFISDVHISMHQSPREKTKQSALCRFFDEVKKSGGTIFILGDFFDFWFDFGENYPAIYQPIIEKLTELRQNNIAIHYAAGNHDYWIEGYLTQKLGIIPYADEITFLHRGKSFFLTHGDGLLQNDYKYRQLKKILRSKLAIFLFSLLGKKLVYRIAKTVSQSEKPYTEEKLSTMKDHAAEMSQFLRKLWDKGYDVAIMGHIHQPTLLKENGRYALILGDWVRENQNYYAIWDGQTLHHRQWSNL
jgi:UDP-2,3-diacylglucosamine hydrolase